jgi:hypothetical protein
MRRDMHTRDRLGACTVRVVAVCENRPPLRLYRTYESHTGMPLCLYPTNEGCLLLGLS